MTTNVWVEQKWVDYKLKWDPEEYGENALFVSSSLNESIQVALRSFTYHPSKFGCQVCENFLGNFSYLTIFFVDLVLYNNADGNYEISIMTKAILSYDGTVIWVRNLENLEDLNFRFF